jgi:Uma2 family endonuclease
MTTDTSNATALDRTAIAGHVELIGGQPIASPLPSRVHQTVVMNLLLGLQSVLPADVVVRSGPLEVAYDDANVLLPDVMVLPVEDYMTEAPLRPLLAVEVLSPESREIDLGVKKEAYRAAGCISYWVFDPDERSIVGWDLVDGEYVEVLRAVGKDAGTVRRPYIVTVSPHVVLRPSAPGLLFND